MSDERGTTSTSMIVFLAGAALGALAVALTTPKTGPQLRGDLKDLGIRMKDRLAKLREHDRNTMEV
ncbi:MAG TPA: hypothetical protein VJ549_05935 [Geothrix sp.]|nr:hypothetical protein [Geothrix sp.]